MSHLLSKLDRGMAMYKVHMQFDNGAALIFASIQLAYPYMLRVINVYPYPSISSVCFML